MENREMLELILLNQLRDMMNSWTNAAYYQFCKMYDITALEDRSAELQDKFLEPYVIDNSVTAE